MLWAIQYKNGEPLWLSTAPIESEDEVGEILVATIRDIVSSVGAYFVEYKPGKKGYLSFEEAAGAKCIKRQSAKKLSAGDELLLQVKKAAAGSKAAALTGNISLTGQLLVVSSVNRKVGFSKHLSSAAKRRLQQLYSEWTTHSSLPDAALTDPIGAEQTVYGLIFRTNSEHATTEQLTAEWHGLTARLDHILTVAATRKPGTVINNRSIFCQELLLRLPLHETVRLITDRSDIYDSLQSIKNERGLTNWQLQAYEDAQVPLAACYQLPKLIGQLTGRHVWLKSGAWLSIEYTEALTVIDVNSGKVESRKDKEAVFLSINQEAAHMIGRQLRLRNLSGIIIIDFINMKSEKNKEALLQTLEDVRLQDPIPLQLHGFTNLGLFELTRKKEKPPLHDVMTKALP